MGLAVLEAFEPDASASEGAELKQPNTTVSNEVESAKKYLRGMRPKNFKPIK